MNNTRYFILMVMLAIGITSNAATDIWTASAAGNSGNDNVTAYVKGTTNTTTEPFQGTASFYFNTGGNANGSWEGDCYYMYIAPAAFNSVELKAGQKIVLTLNYTQGDSKVYLRYSNSRPSNPEGWTLIKEESASGSIWTYALTSDDVTSIKAHGLGIGGIYINFTKVSIADADESTDPPTPETVKGFHINGTHLVDAKGNDFLIRGYNYSYSWQTGYGYGPIDKAKEVGCNAIRLNISNGNLGFTSYTDYSTLASLISYCEQKKLVCIPEVQDPLGSNSIGDLDKAVDYWLSVKGALIGHENTVIINIANEWVEGWEEQADTWRDGYVKAVKALRGAGLKHTIMIDCAGYGQYPDVIWTHGQDIIDAEKEANGGEVNIMFSIHFYEHACYEDFEIPSGSKVAAAMDKALAMNVPLCVGEFGYARKGGSWHCDWETILKYGKTRNVGYLGWSYTGNGEGDGCLDMFDGNGNMQKNGDIIINTPEYGIKATSVECTVFNDTPENSVKLPEYAAGIPSAEAETELAGLKYTKINKTEGITAEDLEYAGLLAGRKLRVMFKENASETAYANVAIKSGENNGAFVSGYDEEFAVAGFKYIDITVTTSMLAKLDAGGILTVGGKGFETEGIYVISPDIAYADGAIEKTEKGKDETTHTFADGDWNAEGSEHHIQGTDGNANSIFKDVQEGDIVEVTYSNVNGGAQMSIKDGARYKKDGNVYYSWINSSVDYMDVSGNGSYRFTVDKKAHAFTDYNAPTDNDGEDMVESLRKNGLRINGKALTITGVTVYGTRELGNAIIGKTTVPHTLTNAYWSPVSLPYAMDAAQISEVFGEGTQVAQLGTCVKNDGTKKVSITMESVSEIEPCKPYLIKAGNEGSNYLFAGAQLFNSRFTRASATDANNLVTFISTAPDYSGSEPKDETTLPVGAWYFNGGKIYKASKEWPIASGLAYFTLNATLQSKGYTLMFGGDEVTGIETVVTGETGVKTSYIYNVNGQNVGTDLNALPSGIYIVNGRKIVK